MASVRDSGVNMLDVKKQNRGAILHLIYESGGISRKEIAHALGLTPAAITMIAGELLEEGLIFQSEEEKITNRKGRREILLKISGCRYAALGVCITRHQFRLLCMDFNNEILFEDIVYTADCRGKAPLILQKLTEIIKQMVQEYDILRTKSIVGIGVSINGIVDSANGVSVNTFHVWEDQNVPVAAILEEALSVPVLLTNNICSLTHGESIMTKKEMKGSLFFIKYGPGLGAAHSLDSASSSVFNYKAIQLGHVISEPNGAPCVCGNQGCLETILHYDSIINALRALLREKRTPILWEMAEGEPSRINMPMIIEAYDAGERVVEQTFQRVIFYLCLTIKDGLTLFDPSSIVLYGELFENHKFRTEMKKELGRYTNTSRVEFSHYNMGLETLGPATTMISLFFENGGTMESKAI